MAILLASAIILALAAPLQELQSDPAQLTVGGPDFPSLLK